MNLKKRKIYTFTNEKKITYNLAEPIDAMEITRDGKYVITVSREGKISFWNTSLGELESFSYKVNKFTYNHYPSTRFLKKHQMVLSMDGSMAFIFISANPEEAIAMVDISTKSIKLIHTKILRDYSGYHLHLAKAMVLSPDNNFFLLAVKETITICKVKKFTVVENLSWENNMVSSLAFNSKSFYFVAGSEEGSMVLYAQQPLKELWRLEKVHSGAINALLFTSDTEKIISAGDDGTVKVWDFHTGEFLKKLYHSEQKISSLEFIEEESSLLITLEHRVVTLHMETLDVMIMDKPSHFSQYNDLLATSRGSKTAIYSSSDGLQLYDTKNFKPLTEFTKFVYGNNTLGHLRLGCGQGSFLAQPPLEISLDSRYVVATITHQKVALWDIKKLELVALFGEESKTIFRVTISPNNRYIFSATFNYLNNDTIEEVSIEMYDVESSLLVYSFEIEERYAEVVLLRVTPDNRYLVAILAGGKMLKWDIEALELVENKGIACHEYDIYSPTISLDGSLVVYGLCTNSLDRKIDSIEISDINLGRRVENIEYPINSSILGLLTINISEDNRLIDLYLDNLHLFCWDRIDKKFLFDSNISHREREYDEGMLISKIAPNGEYRINIYEDEKRGLSVWNMKNNRECHRLFVAERNNSMVMNVVEKKIILNGKDKVLLSKIKEVGGEEFKRVEFEKYEG